MSSTTSIGVPASPASPASPAVAPHVSSSAASCVAPAADTDGVTSRPALTTWLSSDLLALWALITEALYNARVNAPVVFAYVWAHVRHAVTSAATTVVSTFGQDSEPRAPPRPEVFRVHAFMGDPYNGEHHDLTHRIDALGDWEARVGALTGWDTTSSKFRVEMRYTYGASRKVYRMLLRHGDAFGLPDAQKRCRIPRNILSAQLVGAGGVACDVLHRVSKYAGPFGDFHAFLGLHARVQELFPFDDQEQNCERFSSLRTIDTTARMREYSYADNPVLVPVAALYTDDAGRGK